MKKVFLLSLTLLLSVAMFAQERAIIIRETFDSASLPEGWTTSDESTENWTISQTNRAGCEANELKLNPSPKAVGFIRIITNAVDLREVSKVTVSFKHFFEKKSIGAVIGIATSSNNGATWSSAWSKAYSSEGLYSVVEEISTSDMGKNNVKFCIYYQGNTENIKAWYFDNIEVMTIENIDAKVESIDVAEFIAAGRNDISFSVQNNGSDKITSFEASYTVNGITVSESFTTDIDKFDVARFTFEEQAYLYPNDYNIEIEITSVNGTQDQNTPNNIARKDITVTIGDTQRYPMIEHFSSSTCASCVNLNAAMRTLTNNNPGKYTYTKYAMSWPDAGDDYYTQEGGVRKSYYGVSSVPHLIFDGMNHTYYAVSQDELDKRYNTPAFIDIKGAFNTDGNNISIVLDVMPYINLDNKKLFVTVNEKTTTQNVEYNGESEFHHIMMKMITGSQGSPISFVEGEAQHFEYTYDMALTHMEEIDDLEVSVWIQDYETKEIYNSRFLYEYTEHPYHVQNLQLNKDNNNIVATWESPESGTPTGYNIFVNGELVSENANVLTYTVENAEAYCSVEVVALYENDKESVGIIATHGLSLTENELNIGIYPNPVNNYLHLNTNENVNEITIYNVLGVMVYHNDSFSGNSINVSELHNGIYFLNIKTDNGNVVKRFLKN